MNYYVIKTLGCKANLSDSQSIESSFQEEGWRPFSPGFVLGKNDRLVCIVNSCTVTNEADRQSRKLASRFFIDHPNARVILTGCSAQVDPEGVSKLDGVHYIVGNQDKQSLVKLISKKIEEDSYSREGQVLGRAKTYAEMASHHPMDRDWPSVAENLARVGTIPSSGFSHKTRVFLKIQEGCDSFCTYCIIPYGRGPSRSLPAAQVLEEIKKQVDAGAKEVVLTGTNIGDYGMDYSGRPMLSELLSMIFSETQIQRLRVSSLDPTEISDEMLALMRNEPRFCPHFHVSLQSPQNHILRLMKRRYGFSEIKVCLEKIHGIGRRVFVGMDLITGFPGESNEDFEEGVQSLELLPWVRLHVFPYSERAGTPATRLPNAVPHLERIRRARVLAQLSLKRMTSWYRKALFDMNHRITSMNPVLLEAPTLKVAGGSGPFGQDPYISGYTPDYLRVVFPFRSNRLRNQLTSAIARDLWIDSTSGEVSIIGDFDSIE